VNTKLVSFRSYAKQRGISVSYVSRLVKQGKIPTHDGLIRPIEADEARGRTTLVGRGQRRWERRHGADVARCVGCGAMFPTANARENGSPDPQHFCEDRCAAEVAAGKSRAEIRAWLRERALDNGATRKELGRDGIGSWFTYDDPRYPGDGRTE